MQFRRGIDYKTSSLRFRSMVDYSKGWGKCRAIVPDLYRSNSMHQYLGNTLYTKFNALYGTKLKSSTNTGAKVITPTKPILNVPLHQKFDGTDGETWSATFGKAMLVSINEMTQSQIIKHMATRTYSNPEWLADLGKLSTKDLVMEYLQQQAELNYLIGVYKDLKMQSIQ